MKENIETTIREGLCLIHEELIKRGLVYNFKEANFMDEEDADMAVEALNRMYNRHTTKG